MANIKVGSEDVPQLLKIEYIIHFADFKIKNRNII